MLAYGATLIKGETGCTSFEFGVVCADPRPLIATTCTFHDGSSGSTKGVAAAHTIAAARIQCRSAADPFRSAAIAMSAADASNPASLTAMAESAKVIISTVGPYQLYGEGLVAACAAAGPGVAGLTEDSLMTAREPRLACAQAASKIARATAAVYVLNNMTPE